MNIESRAGRLAIAIALAVGFFAYYSALSHHISFNGGPDEEAHYHAARFIAEHGRLAVYPDDEPELYFPPAGVTLSFRPPFAYLVGVATSPLFAALGLEEKVEFRAGSALLAALAVSILFLAINALVNSLWLSLFGALCFGLLPQFAFLASYFNDDPGAIMVVTLLTYCIALLITRPVSWQLLVLTGFAIGLVIISKPTAWVVSTGLTAYVAVLVLRDGSDGFRKLSLVIAVALIVGGWWIAFNVFHHGLQDPLNFGIETYLMGKYRDAPIGAGLSYADQGVSVWQLFANYDNFLVRTYKSAVGNLDWLRLEMGPLQYRYYGALLLIAIGGSVVRLLVRNSQPPGKVLHAIFLLSVILQIAAYLWMSLFREAQVQGRYVLTVLPLITLMACCAIRELGARLHAATAGTVRIQGVPTRLWITLLVISPVYVHLQGLVHYAVPFYKFDFYHGLTSNDFKPWYMDRDTASQVKAMEVDQQQGGSVLVVSSGIDPWIVFGEQQAERFANGVMLRVTLESKTNGIFAVYWDDGQGMSEQFSTRRHYNIGHQTIYLRLSTRDTKFVRLDPMDRPGRIVIYEMAIAPLSGGNLTISGFLAYLARRWIG